MMMIIAVVVVVVVVVAAAGYFLFMKDSGEALTGKWTVSGGEVKMVMVVNNDTANTTWMNETIPASAEIIDFDDETTMPEGMNFVDLGDGEFEITGFTWGDADFGTITGTYDIDGDTMVITYHAAGSTIDEYSGDYMEIEMDQTINFAKA